MFNRQPTPDETQEMLDRVASMDNLGHEWQTVAQVFRHTLRQRATISDLLAQAIRWRDHFHDGVADMEYGRARRLYAAWKFICHVLWASTGAY